MCNGLSYIINKLEQGLGRALDLHTNGASLSKLTEWNFQIFILGGQIIYQKKKKEWWRG